MRQVREAAVAGIFYPEDRDHLKSAIGAMAASVPEDAGQAPKALIVPHAGYVYSGQVAAAAFARLLPHRETYRRVVLMGPAHRMPLNGLAASGAYGFRTPFGVVRVDREALASLACADVRENNAAHLHEHCLEVQLPFLQFALGDFLLVPLLAGDTTPESVAEVIERSWNGPETLIVVSSDLSHYLDYEQAQSRDRVTCRAIERMDVSAIGRNDACGATVISGLLITARNHGLEIETLGLRNSGDTAGDKRRVVGYGAWLLREAAP